MSAGEIRSTDAPVDDPYGEQTQIEDAADMRREQDWHWLAAEVAEFVKKYGLSALLRCVADGVGTQQSLLR